MNIGLKSGVVRLERNHNAWARYFASISASMKRALKNIDCKIEHVGSTAIPGIDAKPIVDIAVGLQNEGQYEIAITKLTSIGFRYRGHRDDSGGHVFDIVERNLALSYIHLVTVDSEQWRRYILFRDYLQESKTARKRYEEIKRDLAERYAEKRKAYTAAKKTMIDSLVEEAKRKLISMNSNESV